MSNGETVQAMKKPAVKAAMNCVGRPRESTRNVSVDKRYMKV